MTDAPSHRRALALLLLPAVLLAVLVFGVALAVAIGTGGGSAAVQARLPRWIPWILAVNHTLVFAILLRALRGEGRSLADLGWTRLPGRRMALEVGVGILLGFVLYGVETWAIDPVGRWVKGTAADVGPGGVDVSGAALVWLVVALVFPFVEESVYRGWGIGVYGKRIGSIGAFAVSTILFGLLHWGQGTWGMIDTALLGVPLGLAFLWRRSLWAPTIGHMAYNAIVIVLGTRT